LAGGFGTIKHDISRSGGLQPAALSYSYDKGGFNYTAQTFVDLNGDARIDLVYFSESDGHIHVCLGDGTGVFSDGLGDTTAPCAQWTTGSTGPAYKYSLARSGTTGTVAFDDDGLIDVNGDGLLDYVHPNNEFLATELQAHLNTGSGFQAVGTYWVGWTNPDQLPLAERPALRAYEVPAGGVGFARMLFDLRDVNGDGIVDIVSDFTGITEVTYGQGRFGTRGASFDSGTVVATSLSLFQQSRYVDGQGWGYQAMDRGLHDITGDGLIDSVSYEPSTSQYTIAPNLGAGQFGPATSFAINTPGQGFHSGISFTDGIQVTYWYPCPGLVWCPSSTGTAYALRADLLDLDGDGMLEFVRGANSAVPNGTDAQWQTATVEDGQSKPLLVSRVSSTSWRDDVTHGLPHSTQASWPVPHYPGPLTNWVVKDLAHQDLGTGETRSTAYSYYDPHYDALNREFGGHKWVRLNEDEGNRYQDVYFRPFDALEERRDVFVNTGGENKLARTTVTEYQQFPLPSYQDSAGRRWVRPTRDTTIVVDDDGGSPSSTCTGRDYAYYSDEVHNWLGLLKSKTDLGLLGASCLDQDPQDNRCTGYDYYIRENHVDPPSYSNPQLVRTQAQYLKSPDCGATGDVKRTTYFYDTMCPSGQGDLRYGAVCEKRIWRGAGLDDARHTYAHDALGRLASEADPDNVTVHHEYYPYAPFTWMTYNDHGHTQYFTEYNPFAGKPERTCGPTYVSDPEHDICDRAEYDIYGRLKKTWRGYQSQGAYVPVLTDEYEYRDASTVFSVLHRQHQDPLLQGSPASDKTVYYNRWGQVVQQESSYPSPSGCASASFGYDGLGRLVKAWTPTAASSCGYQHPTAPEDYAYEHDPLNRLTRQTHVSTQQAKVAVYVGITTSVLDEAGWLTEYHYDGHGGIDRLRKSDPGGGAPVWYYQRDAAGRIMHATDASGAVYEYGYAGDDTLLFAGTPTGTTEYQRTPAGRLVRSGKSNGDSVFFVYDDLGRVALREVTAAGSCKDELDTQQDIFAYDTSHENTGRLTRVESNRFAKDFDYDAQGAVTFRAVHDLQSGLQLHVTHTRSPIGLILKTTFPSGRIVDHGYDLAGKLSTASDSQAFGAWLTYDADGAPSVVQGWTTDGQQTRTFERGYEYDEKRRVHHLSWNIGSGAHTGMTTFGYLTNDRLSWYSDTLRNVNHNYGYDAADRLRHAEGTGIGSVDYTYHPNGALDVVTKGGTLEEYHYTDNTQTMPDAFQDGSGVMAIAHDASGQQCSADSPVLRRDYTWFGDGKLASIESLDKESATTIRVRYDYDNTGSRWRKTRDAGGEEITLYLDSDAELTGEEITEYVGLPGIRLALGWQGTQRAYFSDHKDTVVIADGAGNLVSTATHWPYGKRIGLSGSDDPEFDFGDKRREDGIGVLDYGARHYDPTTRIFLSMDPMRLVGVGDTVDDTDENLMQPYAFGASNPTTYVDPDGRKVVLWRTANPQQKAHYQQAIKYLQKSPTAWRVYTTLDAHRAIVVVIPVERKSGYNPGSQTIDWSILTGIQPMTNGGVPIRGKLMSSALVLLHEMGHALRDITNHPACMGDHALRIDKWGDFEEKRNIQKVENPAARELGEPVRTNQLGQEKPVNSPTSTSPASTSAKSTSIGDAPGAANTRGPFSRGSSGADSTEPMEYPTGSRGR